MSIKLKLNEIMEVSDGHLRASVRRGHFEVEWTSNKDPRIYEVIEWRRDGGFTYFVQQEVEGKYKGVEALPENLMRHRTLFEGVHKDIDKLLKAYDKGGCENLKNAPTLAEGYVE
jgi:hypothetical protein